MNKTVGEEPPELLSFLRVVYQHRAERGGSSPGDGDTKVGKIDTVVDIDGDLYNG